jgi:hypothetical protein
MLSPVVLSPVVITQHASPAGRRLGIGMLTASPLVQSSCVYLSPVRRQMLVDTNAAMATAFQQ